MFENGNTRFIKNATKKQSDYNASFKQSQENLYLWGIAKSMKETRENKICIR